MSRLFRNGSASPDMPLLARRDRHDGPVLSPRSSPLAAEERKDSLAEASTNSEDKGKRGSIVELGRSAVRKLSDLIFPRPSSVDLEASGLQQDEESAWDVAARLVKLHRTPGSAQSAPELYAQRKMELLAMRERHRRRFLPGDPSSSSRWSLSTLTTKRVSQASSLDPLQPADHVATPPNEHGYDASAESKSGLGFAAAWRGLDSRSSSSSAAVYSVDIPFAHEGHSIPAESSAYGDALRDMVFPELIHELQMACVAASHKGIFDPDVIDHTFASCYRHRTTLEAQILASAALRREVGAEREAKRVEFETYRGPMKVMGEDMWCNGSWVGGNGGEVERRESVARGQADEWSHYHPSKSNGGPIELHERVGLRGIGRACQSSGGLGF